MALGAAGLVAESEAGGLGKRVERQAYLMGTQVMLATVADTRTAGLELLDGVLHELESTESELSTWRPDTLLSQINRQPVGWPSPAPDEVCVLLTDLQAWSKDTGGAFDPAIGSLIVAWAVRDGGRIPTPEELDEARRRAGLALVEVELDPCRVTRSRDVTLDAGAFGKGAAVDRAARTVLAGHEGPWMIDLGGQVTVGSTGPAGWPVALAHPRRRSEAALELRLRTGSLATSAGSVRDQLVLGGTVGHIIDPRTGQAVSRSASVSVWHRSALAADVLSTALYVMGVDEGLVWAEARGLAACFLVPDAEGSGVAVRATPSFRRRFLEGPGDAPSF